MNDLSTKRILITGITGFVGRNLYQHLKKLSGIEVFGIISNKSSNEQIEQDRVYRININNSEEVNYIIKQIRPHVIYNLAADIRSSRSLDNLNSMLDVNLIGASNLLMAVIKEQISLNCFVQMGTTEEYGETAYKAYETTVPRPVSIYSGTKAAATMVCTTLADIYKIPLIIVRPSLIYGPGQDKRFFIPNAIESLKKNEDFKMTLGEQFRDFIFIDDVVKALSEFIFKGPFYSEIFNLSYGKSHQLKEVVKLIKEIMQSQTHIKYGSIDYRKNEVFNCFYSNEKIISSTKWKPTTSLIEGLKRTINDNDSVVRR